VRYLGIDISPRSISYSAAALGALGIAESRYRLLVADATSATASVEEPCGAAICCEVLEHVDEPGSLLAALQHLSGPDAPAFVSTVANMEAEDHVYLFHDVDDIRATLRASGYGVVVDQPLVLEGAEHTTPTPLNYSAVLRRPH
jgi:2-polyprenyl-3-methyl-5-hydroxy-6-metoxy-1,4-benzoquinol methylase